MRGTPTESAGYVRIIVAVLIAAVMVFPYYTGIVGSLTPWGKIGESLRSFIRIIFIQNSNKPNFALFSQRVTIWQISKLICKHNFINHLTKSWLNIRNIEARSNFYTISVRILYYGIFMYLCKIIIFLFSAAASKWFFLYRH